MSGKYLMIWGQKVKWVLAAEQVAKLRYTVAFRGLDVVHVGRAEAKEQIHSLRRTGTQRRN